MNKNIEYNLKINAENSLKSLTMLRQEMKEINLAMTKASAVGDKVMFEKLKTRLTEVRDAIKDFREETVPLEGKLAGLSRNLGIVISVFQNFGLVLGADKKSMEELAKTFAKVQAITNISQGVAQLTADFGKMKSQVLALIPALRSFGASMVATLGPVGLIVTAIGAIGMAVASAIGSMNKLSEAEKKLKYTSEKLNEAKLKSIENSISEKIELERLKSAVDNSTKGTKEYEFAVKRLADAMGLNIEKIKDKKKLEEEINKLFEEKMKFLQLEAEAEALKNVYIEERKKYYKLLYEQTTASEAAELSFWDNVKNYIKSGGSIVKTAIENVNTSVKKYNNEITKAKENSENFYKIWKNAADATDLHKQKMDELTTSLTKNTEKREKIIIDKMNFIEATQTKLNKNDETADDVVKKQMDRRLKITEKYIKLDEEYRKTEKEKLKQTLEDGLISYQEYYDKLRNLEDYEKNRRIKAHIDFAVAITDIYGNLSKLVGEKMKTNAMSQKIATLISIAANTAYALMENMKDAAVAGITPIEKAVIYASSVAQVLAAAAQAKAILSEAPSFAKGGLISGLYDGSDNQVIKAMPGEAIINRAATQKYAPILSVINQSTGGEKIGKTTGSLIDYDLLASKINDKRVFLVTSDVNVAQQRLMKRYERAKLK